MKTAIYMRVSTEDQAKEGYSLPSQRRRLLAYCDARGWEVVAVYSDDGIGAKFLDTRPQAMQMLQDAKDHHFENIVILKVDRLFRNVKELLAFVDDLTKYNVKLNSAEEAIDYTSPTGRLMLTMLGAVAELERETITARTNAGKEQKRIQGYKVNGGFLPFAYDFVDGQFIPNERKETVQLLYKLYNSGLSANKICYYLRWQQIPSPLLKPHWERNTIIRILKNETYKGYIRGIPSKNIEPIVSEEEFDDAQIKLGIISKNKTRKKANDDFYFADVAYCFVCGRKLACKRESKPRSRKYYSCQFNSSKHLKMGDEGAHSARMENAVFESLFIDYFDNFDLDLVNAKVKPDDRKIASIDKSIASYEHKKRPLHNARAEF